jgi:hypothetical protein
MGWRFRKSLPGVRLNLTGRGLSATFGVAPFSVNVGPKGVYGNVSIPGTGIWTRQRIGAPSSPLAGTEEQSQASRHFVPPSFSTRNHDVTVPQNGNPQRKHGTPYQ